MKNILVDLSAVLQQFFLKLLISLSSIGFLEVLGEKRVIGVGLFVVEEELDLNIRLIEDGESHCFIAGNGGLDILELEESTGEDGGGPSIRVFSLLHKD